MRLFLDCNDGANLRSRASILTTLEKQAFAWTHFLQQLRAGMGNLDGHHHANAFPNAPCGKTLTETNYSMTIPPCKPDDAKRWCGNGGTSNPMKLHACDFQQAQNVSLLLTRHQHKSEAHSSKKLSSLCGVANMFTVATASSVIWRPCSTVHLSWDCRISGNKQTQEAHSMVTQTFCFLLGGSWHHVHVMWPSPGRD